MKGFDSEFQDLRDYILKITYRIWEQKGIDTIRDYYAKVCPVYTPLSEGSDVEEVVKGTLETLSMFPDRTLLGEDIIGKEYDGVFYSSHRIFSNMTHRGDGSFGKASGNAVATRTIADCVCKNNQVVEEWLARDQSKMVKDIGLCPEAFGRALAKPLNDKGAFLSQEQLLGNWRGGMCDSGAINGHAKTIAEGLEAIWVQGAVGKTFELHDRACYSYFAGGREFYGVDALAEFMASFGVCLSGKKFEVNHFIEVKEENEPIRIALRWALSGEHKGYGVYGKPSNAPLAILGMSHFELRAGKILRAYHIFDELSIWAQIENHQAS